MYIYTGEGAWAPAYPYTGSQAYEDFESLCTHTQKAPKFLESLVDTLRKPLEIFKDL